MSSVAEVYYKKLARAFGDLVPPRDCVDVCGCLYPSLLGLFYEVAQFEGSVQVRRVWVEQGGLQIALSGSAPGLDELVREFKEEAFVAMAVNCRCFTANCFALGCDHQLHARLRRQYGDLVPARNLVRVRSGLFDLVGRLFNSLATVGCPDLRVVRIETRNAGFFVVETTGANAAANSIVTAITEAARTTCEHCSDEAQMIVKVGEEVRLIRPNIELQDRLLCLACASAFQNEMESL